MNERRTAIALVVAPHGGMAHYVLHLWEPLARNARLTWCASPEEPILDLVTQRTELRVGLARDDAARIAGDGFEVVNFQVATRLVAALESHREFAVACRALGLRVIHTLHNAIPHSVSRYDPARLDAFYDLADGFLVGNPREEERLRATHSVAGRPVAVARHGPYTGFATGTRDRAAARRALGIPIAAPVVLFFGSYRPDKGLEVLLEAFPLVQARRPDSWIVIATSPRHGPEIAPFLADLRAASAARAGWLVRDSYTPDAEIATLFDAADVVALPNLRVSQSGVRALAAAFGRALVLTDAFEDAASLDGIWGRAVAHGDALAFADGLLDLLGRSRLERDALGAAGRERALREESWEANAEAVAGLAARILAP
jgi:glycosyltransferase involved in cell wall biosynthesis